MYPFGISPTHTCFFTKDCSIIHSITVKFPYTTTSCGITTTSSGITTTGCRIFLEAGSIFVVSKKQVLSRWAVSAAISAQVFCRCPALHIPLRVLPASAPCARRFNSDEVALRPVTTTQGAIQRRPCYRAS